MKTYRIRKDDKVLKILRKKDRVLVEKTYMA